MFYDAYTLYFLPHTDQVHVHLVWVITPVLDATLPMVRLVGGGNNYIQAATTDLGQTPSHTTSAGIQIDTFNLAKGIVAENLVTLQPKGGVPCQEINT